MPEQAQEFHENENVRRPSPQLRQNPLIKPLVALALPGMYLFYKYNQYKRKRKENATRRLAERELQHLNSKIEKLLSKLDESEPELATCREEECVICIHAKATMQTSPCEHQVVCRKCFVKTIQIAVSQRLLPLRCVVCRAKVLRLKTIPAIPSSISGYSMMSSSNSSRISSMMPPSESLYSVSSGGSSVSSASTNSDASSLLKIQQFNNNNNNNLRKCCCGGRCVGGAHPRQPSTGAIRRSQKQDMKMTLKDYCRPEKNHFNRLPPIRESSPLHSVPPASTRIRCAQKIVTQLEMPFLDRSSSKGYKYEKLQQDDDEEIINKDFKPSPSSEEGILRNWFMVEKTEENIDNKKNEIMEKNMEKFHLNLFKFKEKKNKIKIQNESF